ncbi:hypothetical protein [Arthrobacter sp. Y-9]|uniref:hypothetical protein n=1 Tax=Arthrobacter sp. Y-9 TaxID=3039385 RepID=UPI00241C3682|nr:hypothetical protein [Arthrobacter sp. Y-9]WFR85163.1 hypothetical protein P9849_05975 [Arthrobacter sp. Y-9]
MDAEETTVDEHADDGMSPVQDPAVAQVLSTLEELEDAPLEEHPAGLDRIHDALSSLLDGPLVPGIQPR